MTKDSRLADPFETNIQNPRCRRKTWGVLIVALVLAGGVLVLWPQEKPRSQTYIVGGYCYSVPPGYAVTYTGWTEQQHGSMLMLLARLPDLIPNAYKLYHPDRDGSNPFFDKGSVDMILSSNEVDNVSGQALKDRMLTPNPYYVKLKEHYKDFDIYKWHSNWIYVRGSGMNTKALYCDGIRKQPDWNRTDRTQGRYGTCNTVFPLFEKDHDQYVYDHAIKLTFGGSHLQDIDDIEKQVRALVLSWQSGRVTDGHCPEASSRKEHENKFF
ncbi:hypothetical protein [Acetobacter sicerae]|uniref:hypothetical protein n=1 Tax=Acetobacter sicerae TaxID=85325 RepID=UPI00156AF653|nr:hypothetical protein [Acetobacter sicerae]NHN92913.1 hypothetical protein [Acetobacter sicerae]